MDDNHKIPAFLPHKLVKSLAEYMKFNTDGTAEFVNGLKVNVGASFNGNGIRVEKLDVTKNYNHQYGLFLHVESFDQYIILGSLNKNLDDGNTYISGVVATEDNGLYLCDSGYGYNAFIDNNGTFDAGTSINFDDVVDFLTKKYTHTVTITQSSSSKTFSFTASGIGTDLNVDSPQDLGTVFGGEKHAGSGTLGSLLDTHAALPSDYTIDGVKIGDFTVADDVFISH